MVDFGAMLRENFAEEEGDEWEPVTGSVVRRLKARGLAVTGEDVRRAVRELGVETRKVDGKLLARSGDILGLADFVQAKMKRSEMRQPAGRHPQVSGSRFGAASQARR